jgi:uncharacterized protein (TIGR03083 family)
VRRGKDDAVLDLTPMLRPERSTFLDLLASLTSDQWALPTECPAYDVKGVATHVLGDDLSLLSRQRDAWVNGLVFEAEDMPGADLRTLLDSFNDRWVATARFFGPALLVEMLRTTGEWTADFYEAVDLEGPCEPVGFFGSTGEPSPYWQAIAREYVERWIHHSQVRRALGLGSLADEEFVRPGMDVIAAAGGVDWRVDGATWCIGPIQLGGIEQTADILTRGHTEGGIRQAVTGPSAAVDILVAAFASDRTPGPPPPPDAQSARAGGDRT